MSVTSTAERKRQWRAPNGCLKFAIEELGQTPDPWQAVLYRAMASKDPVAMRIAMKACKGVGKTTGLATCILWFMVTQGDELDHPKGAACSITEANIDDNLWPEIAKWQRQSAYLTEAFTWTKTRYFATNHPETWFFSKRTFNKSGDAVSQGNTLAGLHSKYLLFVVDESGDVPTAVFAAADAGLTGTESGRFQKILQAGNPTKRTGPLFNACNEERSIWSVIEITGDPDDPQRSTRQSIDWARDQIKRYGKDSPWVQINVFGNFPESSVNSLISDVDVRKCFEIKLEYDGYKDRQKRLGIDVARFGDDNTVIAPRQGLRFFNFVEMNGARTTEIADKVIYSKLKWGSELEFVDGTGGFGGGVIDIMVDRGYSPVEVNFSSKANDSRYFNRRAEMYFELARIIKRGAQIPKDELLLAELCATTYTFKSGKLILEPKDLIKEKLGRSPDRADAYALTCAQKERYASKSALGKLLENRRSSALSEWDPINDALHVED